MKDLFDIFPDLPWRKTRPVQERLREVHQHADQARKRMTTAVTEQKAVAKRAQENWRRPLVEARRTCRSRKR